MRQLDPERKIVFGVSMSGQGDGIPLVMMGIPKGAWEWMKDGRTHSFDLTKVGLPVKLILYGAKNYNEALAAVKQHNKNIGVPTKEMMDEDFSIQPKDHTSHDDFLAKIKKAIGLANYVHCSPHEWPEGKEAAEVCQALLDAAEYISKLTPREAP